MCTKRQVVVYFITIVIYHTYLIYLLVPIAIMDICMQISDLYQ